MDVIKKFWGLILVVSLVLNIALASLSFILQPIWFAAEIAEKVATVKAVEAASRRAAVRKEKAKARLRRTMVAIPIAGIAAASYFEYAQYKSWQVSNTELEFADYASEIGDDTEQVMDEVLQELPKDIRPSEGAVQSLVSKSTSMLRRFLP
jgi:hypothetical protein